MNHDPTISQEAHDNYAKLVEECIKKYKETTKEIDEKAYEYYLKYNTHNHSHESIEDPCAQKFINEFTISMLQHLARSNRLENLRSTLRKGFKS